MTRHDRRDRRVLVPQRTALAQRLRYMERLAEWTEKLVLAQMTMPGVSPQWVAETMALSDALEALCNAGASLDARGLCALAALVEEHRATFASVADGGPWFAGEDR